MAHEPRPASSRARRALPARAWSGLLAAAALGACAVPNPYEGVDEPLYRGRPAAFWIEELRYDLPRGYESDVVPAIAHLAASVPRAQSVLEALLVDHDGDVRRRAFAALAEVDPAFGARYEERLVAALRDPDPQAAARALETLAALHARGARLPALAAAVGSLEPRPDLAWSPVLDAAARRLVGPHAVGADAPGRAATGRALADAAVRLAPRPEPAYLDTLAWAAYRAGDAARATELARQAIAGATDLSAEQRARYEASLRAFTER